MLLQENLPKEYNVETKDATLKSVNKTIDQLAASGDFLDNIEKLIEGYYCAGFGLGLNIVSTDELDNAAFDGLKDRTIVLLKKHQAARIKILNVPDTVRKAQIPDFGKAGGSALPGWENDRARQKLVELVLGQLKADVVILNSWKEDIESDSFDDDGDKREAIANGLSMTIYDQFLIGLIDSLMFTRKSDFDLMLETIKVKGKNGDFEYTFPAYMERMRTVHNGKRFLQFFSKHSEKYTKSKKKAGKKPVDLDEDGIKIKPEEKPVEPRTIKTVDVAISIPSNIARFFAIASGMGSK
jgi:hypothetical protein